MNKHLPSLIILACVGTALAAGVTACNRVEASADPVARGRHIVHNVAMCVDCHTPHLPDGRLDPERELAGSQLPFTPSVPMPWAGTAPALAGLPTYPDDASIVRFLTTGQTNHGTPTRPPMPGYRMSDDEARAVVAYLRSIKPVKF